MHLLFQQQQHHIFISFINIFLLFFHDNKFSQQLFCSFLLYSKNTENKWKHTYIIPT